MFFNGPLKPESPTYKEFEILKHVQHEVETIYMTQGDNH